MIRGNWLQNWKSGWQAFKAPKRRPARRSMVSSELLEARQVLSAVGTGAASMNLANPQSIVNGTQTTAYPSVGICGDASGGFASGTLIGSRWVLTAAHVTEGLSATQGRFTVNGQTYSTIRIHNHPQYSPNVFGSDMANDIALMELDRDVVGVTPSVIARSAPAVGQLLTIVGFGGGGTGTTGHNGDFGVKRVGTTPVDQVTSTLIHWNFDNNTESNTAPGDSGGPAYATINGAQVIVGVTSGGDQANAGIGDHSFDTRVDAYASWIDSVVGTTGGGGGGTGGGGTGGGTGGTDDHVNAPGAGATVIALNANGQGSGSGTFEAAGDRDVFAFTVAQSGSVAITLTGSNGLDTYLRLYSSNGQLLAENDDANNTLNSALSSNLTAGTYYLSAGAYNDAGTGTYQAAVDFDPAAPVDDHANDPNASATLVTLDAAGHGTATGTLEVAGDRDVFKFTVTKAGSVTVALSATGDLDTYLRLYNSNGQVVAENDDFNGTLNSSITASLAAGTYYLSAGSYNDAGTGAYQASINFTATETFQDYFFSVLDPVTLTNSNGTTLVVDDSDIVKLTVSSSGSYSYSMYFDGSDVGLTNASEDLDAFTILADGRIVLSTTGAVAVTGVSGGGNDLLTFTPSSTGETTAGVWSVFLRGSSVQLPATNGNIDAVEVLADGSIIVSTTASVTVGTRTYNREDLIKISGTTLSFYVDGSDIGLSTTAENIDSLDIKADGTILIGTRGAFAVTGVSGGFSDIAAFRPTQLGATTTGTFNSTLAFAAQGFGLQTFNLDGFQVGTENSGTGGGGGGGGTTTGGFQITVRFTDSTLTTAQRAIFQQAADRWAQIIVGDLPDVVVDGLNVDDVVIDASAPTIDGVSGILGQAGPTAFRSGTFLPSRGIMEFDQADLADLQSTGDLLPVILHEMGHVLGIGTIWEDRNLVSTVGSEIHFTGARAVAEYNAIFGTTGNFVPVETDGGPGTAGGHWDEAIFDNELMSGYLNGGTQNPISRVTVGALADMGYQVNMNAADAYTAPRSARTKDTVYVWGDHDHDHSNGHAHGRDAHDHEADKSAISNLPQSRDAVRSTRSSTNDPIVSVASEQSAPNPDAGTGSGSTTNSTSSSSTARSSANRSATSTSSDASTIDQVMADWNSAWNLSL